MGAASEPAAPEDGLRENVAAGVARPRQPRSDVGQACEQMPVRLGTLDSSGP